jgi:hypothetical protein
MYIYGSLWFFNWLNPSCLWLWDRHSLWRKWVPRIFSREERRSLCMAENLTSFHVSNV